MRGWPRGSGRPPIGKAPGSRSQTNVTPNRALSGPSWQMVRNCAHGVVADPRSFYATQTLCLLSASSARPTCPPSSRKAEAKALASEPIGTLTERQCKQKHLARTAVSNQSDNEQSKSGAVAHPHPQLVSRPPLPNASRQAPATIPKYSGGMVFDRSFDAAGSIVTTLKPGSSGKKVENGTVAAIPLDQARSNCSASSRAARSTSSDSPKVHTASDTARTFGYGNSFQDVSIRLWHATHQQRERRIAQKNVSPKFLGKRGDQ